MPNNSVLYKLEEIFKLGDNPELWELAAEVAGELAGGRAEDVGGQRWIYLRLASMACGKGPLEKRLPLITALAKLGEREQPLHLEYCRDREEITGELGRAGRWPELLSLLRASLLRWQPETEGRPDLIWLTRCFVKVKENGRAMKAELNLRSSGGGVFQASSSSYMNILLEETLAAAATAWHRCLRGPGGVNFCLDNLWIFQEEDLSDELVGLLAQDPVAYIALVKEAAEDRSREGLRNILELGNLLQGALASEYCLSNLLGECLSGAKGSDGPLSDGSLKKIGLALGPAKERLLQLLNNLSPGV